MKRKEYEDTNAIGKKVFEVSVSLKIFFFDVKKYIHVHSGTNIK